MRALASVALLFCLNCSLALGEKPESSMEPLGRVLPVVEPGLTDSVERENELFAQTLTKQVSIDFAR